MGSRGAGSGRSGSGEVPFDKWGKMIENGFDNRKPIYDEKGNEVGTEFVEDYTAYVQVPFVQEATVSQVTKDINAWKNDDGTYGDDDTVMGVYYSNGDYIDSRNDDFGKRYAKNKRDIVGATISTPDYEAAAGKAITRNGWVDMETSDVAGRSYSNAYVGYVATGMYKVRQKTTYLEGSYAKAHGKRTVQHERVRQSTVKPLEVPKKFNNGYGKTILIDRNNPL